MRIYVDGAVFPPELARIPVLDHGFLYGDSVYDVVRTYGRRPFRLLEHLERLERSAARIALTLPARERILQALYSTGAEVHAEELYLRIIVSRGVGRRPGIDPMDFGDPTLVIVAAELPSAAPQLYERGCTVALAQTRRNPPEALDPAIKSGNSLNNVLAMMEAKGQGSYEALFLSTSGHLTEGTRSNVFLVLDGTLCTPPLQAGLLPGVTRGEVFALCRQEGIELRETLLGVAELARAEELFLTSTTKGVLPVAAVGRHPVGRGAPGPCTARILEGFERRVRAFVDAPESDLDRRIPHPE